MPEWYFRPDPIIRARVKPLEWHEVGPADADPMSEDLLIAFSLGGVVAYEIVRLDNGRILAFTPPTDERFGADYGTFESVDEAKKACQADHEKTVMEFLEVVTE